MPYRVALELAQGVQHDVLALHPERRLSRELNQDRLGHLQAQQHNTLRSGITWACPSLRPMREETWPEVSANRQSAGTKPPPYPDPGLARHQWHDDIGRAKANCKRAQPPRAAAVVNGIWRMLLRLALRLIRAPGHTAANHNVGVPVGICADHDLAGLCALPVELRV
jgi:hypothetical protein